MKRDVDYMIDLLREFEHDKSRIRLYPKVYGMDEKQFHHLELLCDEGMVAQVSDSGFRITKWGHDFLDHMDKGYLKKAEGFLVEKFGIPVIEVTFSMVVNYLREKFGF